MPHVCPEHVQKPTRMGEDVFSVLFHLKFKAMKFFTVRDIPGIPREMFGRNHRHVPGGKVAVCAGFFFNKSYPNNFHIVELPRFLGTEYLQDMFYI